MACILRTGIREWNNGRVPFVINADGFTPAALLNINKAINHWNTKTNWQVIPRNREKSYVEFRVGEKCSSKVGRRGGKQSITLANNCGYVASIHEIGHAIGFKHEQTRYDRDNHVFIIKDRVISGRKHNYDKVSPNRYLDHGEYDYGSIMHYGKGDFLIKKRLKWAPGWTNVKTYKVGNDNFLFTLQQTGGYVKIHSLDASIGVGREIQRLNWTSGWTTSEFFTIGTKTFLFLLKKRNGLVNIHSMNKDGTIGPLVRRYDWSGGWTSAEFWQSGNKTYLFLLKRSNGTVNMHKMNGNGTVGAQIQSHDWSAGWTSTKIYQVGGQAFLFLLKSRSGTVHIHKMNNNGTLGAQIQDYKWSSGWSNVRFFYTSKGTLLFLLKKRNGTVHVHQMNADGTVGNIKQELDWTSGWSSSEFFSDGYRNALFLLKGLSGIVHTHSMERNGKVGGEFFPVPPFNIYVPPHIKIAIGQASGLSAGDISAANSML